MQVSQVQDSITHAVIGGHKAIEMGFANTSALMHVLSTTLYRDQILAVVREVVCNAWDSHVESGRTAIYITITLTHEKLIIRDFGNGIHPDMMGPLYGTYGGTNKLLDANQTGGFGLGCKAPFAYTDHFEVQSFHKGMKTIYNLSKSSAERNGKPSITPIASFPTDESGVQVSIPIKANDRRRFEDLTARIIRNGSMYAKINGAPAVEVLPFIPTSNYLITTQEVLDTYTPIALRYGNVIYPVERVAEIGYVYDAVTVFMKALSDRERYTIIFQAPGHSISVTPSRESLSMQEHTVNTIKGLLAGFLPQTHTPLVEECFKVLDQRITSVKAKGEVGHLLNSQHVIPGTAENRSYGELAPIRFINSLALIAQQKLKKGYPDLAGFRQTDLDKRVSATLELGFGHKGHLQEIRQLLKGPTNKMRRQSKTKRISADWVNFYEKQQAFRWYQRRIVRKLARDMVAEKMLLSRFFIRSDAVGTQAGHWLVDFSKYQRNTFAEYLPILRNIVVLTHAKMEIGPQIKASPLLKTLGSSSEVFLYVTPFNSKKILPKLREFFTSRGFNLIDLTDDTQEWVPARPTVERLAPSERTPRRTGYPALSGAVRSATEHTHFSRRMDNVMSADAPRVQKPLFYYRFNQSRADVREWAVGRFTNQSADAIVKLWGSVCACISTDPQEEKMKEANVPSFNQYVVPYVIDQVTNAPQFKAYWTESMENALGGAAGDIPANMLGIVTAFDIPEVRTVMGLNNNLSDADIVVLMLWRDISANYQHDYDEKHNQVSRKAARDLIMKIPVGQTAKDLAAKVKGNPLLGVLDLRMFHTTLHHSQSKQNGYAMKLAEMVKIALLG